MGDRYNLYFILIYKLATFRRSSSLGLKRSIKMLKFKWFHSSVPPYFM